MNCPKCNQVVEAGAAFCGNCGQALRTAKSTAAPLVPAMAGVPGYALARPGLHVNESKALAALILGLAGIVGSIYLALFGLALGIAGLVLGTMSQSGTKRGLSTAGIVASSLAVLASMGVWTYAVKHDPGLQKAPAQSQGITAPAVSASSLTTPCYSAGFVDRLNVSNNSGSCDMSAFNGPTIGSSSNAYKVYADQSSIATPGNFDGLVKPAIEKDIKANLPSFTINSEQVTQFAGSPAYAVNSSNKALGVTVVEAAVLHRVGNGDNLFILVHAVNGSNTDLSTIEAQWQWK